MKKISLLFASLLVAGASMAQISVTGSSLIYNQDFNGLGSPSNPSALSISGWSLYEYGTGNAADNNYLTGDGSSNAGNTYSFGATGSNDRALGSVGSGSVNKIFYGATFANNTGTSINSFSINFTGEQWRKSTAIDSLRFEYSLTAVNIGDTALTSIWTEVPALLFIAPNTDTAASAIDGNLSSNQVSLSSIVTVTVPDGQNLMIRWADRNSSGIDDGMSIDDLNITFSTSGTPIANYKPTIVSLSPADNATGVAANANLVMTFNRNVTAGSGSIHINNMTTPGTVTKAATSSDVVIAGNVVTVSNTGLTAGSMYNVQFDSTAFDTAGYKSYGIYNTTDWNFSVGTTNPGGGTVTSLAETFDAACANGGLPAGWAKENVAGPSQSWRCNIDNEYLDMNGFANQTGNDNEDWLITPKVNLNGVTNPTLSFWAYKGFDGSDIKVQVSTDYTGTGNPNSATWTDLGINFANATTTWINYTKNMSVFTTAPFYLSFKYACTQAADDCAQWRIDSLYLNGTSSIASAASGNTLQATIIGNATTENIVIACTLADAGNITASIFDMAGRKVYANTVRGNKGSNTFALNPTTLNAGMYIVRLSNGKDNGIVKVVVQ